MVPNQYLESCRIVDGRQWPTEFSSKYLENRSVSFVEILKAKVVNNTSIDIFNRTVWFVHNDNNRTHLQVQLVCIEDFLNDNIDS